MNDAWLKIKAWTKGIVIALIAIYALIFIYNNSGKDVDFWWWFKHTHTTTVFLLAVWAFLAGAVTALIAVTTWNTLRQLREMRLRSRTERLEREMADMQAKAAMLQPRTGVAPASTASAPGAAVAVDPLGGPR